MTSIELNGSSWNHPRGHAPLLATAAAYASLHDGSVTINWKPRTLKEFGTTSVESLALEFDLIVIDHPHVGTMARSGCVIPLDEIIDPSALEQLAVNSPGRSHESYQYDGHQWALAIDAACQTSAWRPDLITTQPKTWTEVIDLAQYGGVLWPLCGTDAIGCFFSLAASADTPCATSRDRLVDREVGRWIIQTMYSVARVSDPRCLEDNPIDVLEALAHSDDYLYSPLLFCYVNYSNQNHVGSRVAFGDIPTITPGGKPIGSLLGGAGIAVSAFSPATREALKYSLYVASADIQDGLYFTSGGQPAHCRAWSDPNLDRLSGGFFSGVARTIDGAWTRPNGPNFAAFQNDMIDLFDDWFDAAPEPESFLDQLDVLYRSSLNATSGES